MAGTLTSIRLDTKLADEAVHVALEEITKLKGFKKLLKDNGGKHKFENYER
jgi:hypothetical protein